MAAQEWQTGSTDEVSLVARDSGSISIGKLLWLRRSLASSVDGTGVTGSGSAGRVSLVARYSGSVPVTEMVTTLSDINGGSDGEYPPSAVCDSEVRYLLKS